MISYYKKLSFDRDFRQVQNDENIINTIKQ